MTRAGFFALHDIYCVKSTRTFEPIAPQDVVS